MTIRGEYNSGGGGSETESTLPWTWPSSRWRMVGILFGSGPGRRQAGKIRRFKSFSENCASLGRSTGRS